MLPLDQLRHRHRFQLTGDLLQLALHRHHRGKHAFHLVPQGALRIGTGVLFGIAEPRIPRGDHIALVHRFFAHQHSEQSGFAAAVAAHQPHFFMLLYIKRHIVKQHALAKMLAHVVRR